MRWAPLTTTNAAPATASEVINSWPARCAPSRVAENRVDWALA
jgi:hypothetical protein